MRILLKILNSAELLLRPCFGVRLVSDHGSKVDEMSTKYYLQRVPVESVKPGYSLAIREGRKFNLFQVESMQTARRSGLPPTITLTSDAGVVLEYQAGALVVRLFGVCEAAAS